MTAFKDKGLQKSYEMARKSGADKSSTFYIEGRPHRGAGHRVAYWNGRNGIKAMYLRNSLAYAFWAAGRDDLREHGPVAGADFFK
jgi:hypothetical protein